MKNTKRFLYPLLVILLMAAFVRLYRINDYMHFLGDEGRDALVIKKMVIDYDPTFIGPITSVGNIYLGPIYYYFMTPFMILFGMDPVGPAVMIALLSLGTIFLIYKISYDYFDQKTAIIASLLYALSPFIINYSRFSWNPNAVPFFGLLIIYGLLKVIVDKQNKWMWVIGLSFGVVVQLHYICLMFGPIIGLTLLLYRKLSLKNIGILILSFVVPLVPYIAFEVHNQFPNATTAFRFITKSGEASTFGLNRVGLTIGDLTERAFWRLVVIGSSQVSRITILLVIGVLLYQFIKGQLVKNTALCIILFWYLVSIMIFGIYQGAIYDYYMVQFFAFPALIIGITFSYLFNKNAFGKLLVVGLLGVIFGYQLINSPLLKEPNRLLALTKERAKFISDQVGDDSYNFALITGSNSDHAYRYFLELWGKTPVPILNPDLDPDRETVTNQLFIICETEECKPLGHPLWEVAGFGMADISAEWDIAGTKIIKLVPLES